MHMDYLKYVSYFPNIQDFSSYPIAVVFKLNCFWSEKNDPYDFHPETCLWARSEVHFVNVPYTLKKTRFSRCWLTQQRGGFPPVGVQTDM